MSEQNGPVIDVRESLRVIGETLLVAKIPGVEITAYNEWLADDVYRAEVRAKGKNTRMKFVYERDLYSAPWRLMTMESEPA